MKRPTIKAPPTPKLDPVKIADDDQAEAEIERGRAIWFDELWERVKLAILDLAAEHDADPLELAKVWPLLIDIKYPRQRQTAPSWPLEVLSRVAFELRRDIGTEHACQLAGIDAKTFRKYRDKYHVAWPTIRDGIAAGGWPEVIPDPSGKRKT